MRFRIEARTIEPVGISGYTLQPPAISNVAVRGVGVGVAAELDGTRIHGQRLSEHRRQKKKKPRRHLRLQSIRQPRISWWKNHGLSQVISAFSLSVENVRRGPDGS